MNPGLKLHQDAETKRAVGETTTPPMEWVDCLFPRRGTVAQTRGPLVPGQTGTRKSAVAVMMPLRVQTLSRDTLPQNGGSPGETGRFENSITLCALHHHHSTLQMAPRVLLSKHRPRFRTPRITRFSSAAGLVWLKSVRARCQDYECLFQGPMTAALFRASEPYSSDARGALSQCTATHETGSVLEDPDAQTFAH